MLTDNQIEKQYVRLQASNRLEDAETNLKWAAKELAKARERLEGAESDEERARIMNQALGFLSSSVLGNLRIDLLADSQAKFSTGNY